MAGPRVGHNLASRCGNRSSAMYRLGTCHLPSDLHLHLDSGLRGQVLPPDPLLDQRSRRVVRAPDSQRLSFVPPHGRRRPHRPRLHEFRGEERPRRRAGDSPCVKEHRVYRVVAPVTVDVRFVNADVPGTVRGTRIRQIVQRSTHRVEVNASPYWWRDHVAPPTPALYAGFR